MPEGQLTLQEPPVLAETVPDTSAIWTYLPMALMSVSMMLMFLRPGGGNGVFMYLAMGVMALSAGAMLLGQLMRRSSERKQRLKGERRDYLRYLAQIRKRVRATITEQQRALAWRHPEPASLRSLARTSRLWERRPADEDFGEIRLAVGEQQLALTLNPVSTRPVEDLEPLCAHALRRFVRAYSTIPGQPLGLYLRSSARVLLRPEEAPDQEASGPGGTPSGEAGEGPGGEAVRALVRAMLGQLAVFHAPEELWIAFCVSDERRPDWEWAKWLPHTLDPYEEDGAGQARRITADVTELDDLLGAEFAERPGFDPEARPGRDEPYTIVVLDGVSVPEGHRWEGHGYRNALALDISGSLRWRPGRNTLRLTVGSDQVSLVRTDRSRKERSVPLGRPDRLGLLGAESLARLITPRRMSLGTDIAQPMDTDVELTTLLGIPDLHRHDPQTLFNRHTGSARLRVPIAVGVDGRPVDLDIKESAQGGMGPHGMLIGATGSGKSELLRTLVLGLALTNSSETLNFILVDFKGGATFLGLEELPHTSAVITNLADEVALVERMQDALHGELIRRQELLRSAGNYTSALEYERARAGGTDLTPLPSLFVVVDEFSELLSAHREFMDLFVMIGRLGRSLGVHLLLASQRLDEGRMHQLESHLSYRIGLRTFSAMESRGVLGVPDAYELPAQPGSGYLKSGVEALTRFRAAYSSGTYGRRTGAVVQARVASQVVPWTSGWVVPRTLDPATEPEPEAEETGEEEALLDVALDRLRGSGPAAHRVWLPPLDEPSPLDVLLPGIAPDPERGLSAAGWSGTGRLRVPVGLVDKPFEQRRDPLVVDLSGAGGHVAVAGGSQSGKSTLARTLIAALALTHTPAEIQFYCLDFGGGGLSQLAALPHVGGVAARLNPERVHRTVAEVMTLLARREQFFVDHTLDSMQSYRRRRAAGEFPDEPFGDVFMVVDGWSTVRQDYDDLIPKFNELAARGLNYGIHLIITTTRWVELSAQVRDQAATRLELRMGDPMDSEIDTRKARSVPRSGGRGITADSKMHFLAGLPRLDGSGSLDDLGDGVTHLVAEISRHWTGAPAPQVRMLPHRLPVSDLPEPEATEGGGMRIPLGIDQDALEPVWHDFSRTPHLIVVGDTESGKTNLLRGITRNITTRYTPEEAKIIAVDYRRTLVDAIPEEYRIGHVISLDNLKETIEGAARAMKSRVPGADIAPARMRRCDWWTGPRLFVLVDDYDMVSGNSFQSPFEPLFENLTLGFEMGLHLVVARSAMGAGRGLSDGLIRRLDEANNPAVLLSCPPTEGRLFGDAKPLNLPPGRALHIARRRPRLMQTALIEESRSQD
ncbi:MULTISPECIES: type VII secretion protein EccCa [Streptomyces]|uniref:Type VII secretion protein EccCa n=2 Tax=Streptomyces TaxID=1883 RepID=A0ABY9J7L1_9ACTN|nr:MULTISPECIES: type VII secretion protein EccCa [unclassified Streptomyces]TXS13176.1 type VII secretion protein EccCa [Streptomyces sp. wa22]WLQ63600.1 type VII secretion protein EccCa [Streptomyces sp. Alt3]WSR09630.1 type VII secretion protein EccCa [Streptomyces sp. NBC_01208]